MKQGQKIHLAVGGAVGYEKFMAFQTSFVVKERVRSF
jgi:hypothetical protein